MSKIVEISVDSKPCDTQHTVTSYDSETREGAGGARAPAQGTGRRRAVTKPLHGPLPSSLLRGCRPESTCLFQRPLQKVSKRGRLDRVTERSNLRRVLAFAAPGKPLQVYACVHFLLVKFPLPRYTIHPVYGWCTLPTSRLGMPVAATLVPIPTSFGIRNSTRRKCTLAYTCSGFPGAAKASTLRRLDLSVTRSNLPLLESPRNRHSVPPMPRR